MRKIKTETSKENGFKETEIGLIPNDWDVIKLGDCIDTKKGRKPETLTNSFEDGFEPYLTADYFRTGNTKQFVDVEKEKNSIIVDKEDIVLIWDGSNAGDVFTGLRGVLASTMVKIIPKNNLTRQHLFYFLKTKFDILNEKTTGSTIPHVSKSIFKGLPFVLPLLIEQQKIAFVLSKIQQAIEQQEKIIAKTKELKRSLMHRLFTYGLRGEELKETEIGLMPESWEVFSISQKCLVKGSTMALTELPLLDTKNTRLELVHGIKVSDMNTVGNEKSINHANIVAYLSKQEAIKKTVPQGSIAFPKRGAAIATNKKRLTTSWTVLDPNLIAIIPNEDIDAEYLYYWFLIFDLRSIQDPGPTPQLNKKDVNPIRFPCPSIEEQKQISSFLSIIDSRHSLSEQKKNCLNELFKSMLQLLMTGQVRVKDIDFGEMNV